MLKTGLLWAALAVVSLGIGGACGPAVSSADAATLADRQARDDASRQAWTSLGHLQDARGGSNWTPYLRQFAAAPDAPTFNRLSVQWSQEARAAALARAFLDQQAGGELDGVPRDVAGLAGALEQAAGRALETGVATEPAADIRSRFETYRRLDVDGLVENHDALRDDLQSAVDLINGRADAKVRALALISRLDDLMATAKTVGVPPELGQTVTDAKALAPTATTDGEVHAALEKAVVATDTLNGIINRTESAPLPPCLPEGGAGQLIWIHLATQQLVAYQDGCPVMAAPVTTGRPALPTDRGTFRIFYKTRAYKMVSPWPPGSPFWYPSTWVYNAMEFVGDGTFIHNADWQPDDTYGPGSQYGPYSSHGCVHVQDGPLARLYNWAQLGATVKVGD